MYLSVPEGLHFESHRTDQMVIRDRSDGSEVTAIKKKDSAEVMHAQRPAYIGNRGAKDMLALEDLRKLSI